MKANQVYNFSTGFKFPQNFLLMNYKLNKTHNHTWKSNADLSRINSWGHKLYINTLLYDYTFLSNNLTRRRGMKIGIVGVRRRPGQNREKDKEKEEYGLLWAVIYFMPPLSPLQLPPSPHRASVAPPAATLSGLAEGRLLPPPPHTLPIAGF